MKHGTGSLWKATTRIKSTKLEDSVYCPQSTNPEISICSRIPGALLVIQDLAGQLSHPWNYSVGYGCQYFRPKPSIKNTK